MTVGLGIALVLCCAANPERERVAIPGTALSIELLNVPASTDGSSAALLVGTTEIPWEVYDCFVYGFDEPTAPADATKGGPAGAADAKDSRPSGDAPAAPQPDAVTRPTKPYISVDRGFGHAGWPAISMSFKGAKAFCEWLSLKTGRHFRLPTVAEWTRLCADAERGSVPLQERAWTSANSGGTTRKVGSSKADALGLHDLCGNVAEWCVADDGTGVVLGGSYRDSAEKSGCAAMQRDTPHWNRSDPQFPKSVWWLADAPHVGMRIVCDVPSAVPAVQGAPSASDAGRASGATGSQSPQRTP